MEVTLSVVIPCYNHGQFIQEAVDSVTSLHGIEYEIIIINDGSSDEYTIFKLRELEATGINVIWQENSGLGFTRNKGIQLAKGKYILPLDADNKIKPEYIYRSIPLLESGNYDIVYGKPLLFGDLKDDRNFNVKAFNVLDLSVQNYIDACAVFRKEVWSAVGGYDSKMPFPGQEDWEFWLHASIRGFRFEFLDEELFYYRIVNNSMIATTSALDKNLLNYQYIVKKHASFYCTKYTELYHMAKLREHDLARPFRSMFKFLYLNHIKRKTASGS